MSDSVAVFPFDPTTQLSPKGLDGLWRLLQGNRLRFVVAMAALAVATLGRSLTSLLIQYFVDGVVGKTTVWQYALVGAGFVGLAVVQAAGSFVGGKLSARTAEGIAQRLRNHLYRHIQILSFAYHDRTNTGELIQRVTGDVEAVRAFYGQQATELGRLVIVFAINLVAIASISPSLALLSVAVVPPLALVSGFFFRAIGKAYEAYQEQDARLTTTLQENLNGVRVVKAFARQSFERDKYETDNRLKLKAGRRLILRNAWFWPITDLLCGAEILASYGVGAVMVVGGQITLGGFLAYIGLLWNMLIPMRMIGRLVVDASKALVSYGRVVEVLREEPEHMAKGLRSGPALVCGIRFHEVSFRYGDGEDVLSGVSLDAPPGSVIALLGPTGSGKTTLMSLLPRFYEYRSGSITLDGVELREYAKEYLRGVIATVEQQPFLFSASIAENIAYGARRAVEQPEIEAAARAAAIHDSILAFPEGYATKLGERGVTLSGGQKQRVAIARALLRDPRVLILDDATSSVDAQTEKTIWDALGGNGRERTTFIIAHRVHTLERADRVVVLQRGRIVQQGTHQELVQVPGIYRTIYDLQTRIEAELEEDLARV